MKAVTLKFGSIGAIVMLVCIIPTLVFEMHKNLDLSTQEVVGYATIFLSLGVILFAMKEYRDRYNNGYISYGEAVKLGVLISLFPSVLFMLYNYYFVIVLDPGFMDQYASISLQQQYPDLAAADIPAKLAEMKAETPYFFNIHFQGALMFFTVLIIGLIESLIFALLVKKNKENDKGILNS